MSSHDQRAASLRNEVSTLQGIEALACELFERTCRDDSFEDLKGAPRSTGRTPAASGTGSGPRRRWRPGLPAVVTAPA